ncbi:MAG: hypothetical protein ACKOAP_05475 [Vulcanococcus sp.]
MSLWTLLLALAVLGLPLAARGQGLDPLRAQGLRCVQGGNVATSCKPFLETAHRLKNRAEAAKRWRCYSALLGYEAQVIAAAAARSPLPLDAADAELSAECEPIR